jgi:hypothetical protein
MTLVALPQRAHYRRSNVSIVTRRAVVHATGAMVACGSLGEKFRKVSALIDQQFSIVEVTISGFSEFVPGALLQHRHSCRSPCLEQVCSSKQFQCTVRSPRKTVSLQSVRSPRNTVSLGVFTPLRNREPPLNTPQFHFIANLSGCAESAWIH